jgi:hypothetical protein
MNTSSRGVDKLNVVGDMSRGRALDSLVCHKCKGVGHFARDCVGPWVGDRLGRQHQDHPRNVVSSLSDLIAPPCATQAAGQAFFCIPERSYVTNMRERSIIVVVTVVKVV